MGGTTESPAIPGDTQTPEFAESVEVTDSAERRQRAEKIIASHVLMSAGSGLVPVTGFDLVAGLTIQLTLLKRLSDLYGVRYSQNIARGIIFSLLSTFGGIQVAQTFAFSAIKLLPIVGTAVGIAGWSTILAAFTFALGKVFTAHLESGGTFLNFDPKVYGDYFGQMFKQGKSLGRNMNKGKSLRATPEAV